MASGTNDGDIHGVNTFGPERLRVPAIALAAASVLLWAILIAGLWVTVPPCALHLVQPAAATTTLASTLLWVAAGNMRQREASRGVLIDTVANLTRSASRVTGPFRMYRVP